MGNIAVEAQRAVRQNNLDYGNRVIMLVDEIVASGNLSYGGIKEMLRVREILCDFFYNGATQYLDSTINHLMKFAFMERA